jgi:hypothetical protein
VLLHNEDVISMGGRSFMFLAGGAALSCPSSSDSLRCPQTNLPITSDSRLESEYSEYEQPKRDQQRGRDSYHLQQRRLGEGPSANQRRGILRQVSRLRPSLMSKDGPSVTRRRVFESSQGLWIHSTQRSLRSSPSPRLRSPILLSGSAHRLSRGID